VNSEITRNIRSFNRSITRLFRSFFAKDLKTLREDISILSFNYDPYLEYLLHRAWATRNGRSPDTDIGNSITSGFQDSGDISWVGSNQRRFYLLKLHGSISEFAAQSKISTEGLFEQSRAKIAGALLAPQNDGKITPIIFPWETMAEDLKFRERDFPLADKRYFTLFVSIWERARKEVEAADKISFVGLSMHEYLKLGLRYLFQDKRESVEVVVANPLNERFRDGRARNRLSPNSPCMKAGDVIAEVSEKRVLCRYSRRDAVNAHFAPENTQQCITPRYSFADFIEHEL
jgi:hypothetical protein